MRNATDFAEHAADICVSALSYAGVAAIGIAPFLTPVAVLGAIGLSHRNSLRRNCVRLAGQRALASMQTIAEFRTANFDRVAALVGDMRNSIRIDPAALDRASRQGAAAFKPTVVALLMDGIPFDADDAIERRVVDVAFGACLDTLIGNPEVHQDITRDLLLNAARDHGLQLKQLERIDTTTTRTEAKVDALAETQDAQSAQLAEIKAMLLTMPNKTTKAKAKGIPEKTLLKLARRIVADVPDAATALRELERAVDIAIRVQAEGAVGSNHGDFVDRVLAQVAALSRDGAYEQGSAQIDAALAQEQADSTACRLRLIAAGIEQDTLARNADGVAARLVQQAEAEGKATFDDLRALFVVWYERGRDAGLNFDLSVSIALARLVLSRARGPVERGAAGNDLGMALSVLGGREPGTARLEQAVAAYRDALQERTRDRVPLDWATTQMNLGNALLALGRRESGTARLEQAVVAYRDALQEFTRDRVPLQWATTQMNLGTALLALGRRESGTARLEQAVAAYRDALQEWTRDRVPLDWARAIGNQGVALSLLAERSGDVLAAETAISQITSAEAAMREGGHEPDADFYASQIPIARARLAPLRP